MSKKDNKAKKTQKAPPFKKDKRVAKKAFKPTQKPVFKYLFTGIFLTISAIALKKGYKYLSVLTFATAVGTFTGISPRSFMIIPAFLSISVSLLATFFDTINYYINGKPF